MSNVVINDENLIAIADAIRDKSGVSTTYKPREMADAIINIPSPSGTIPITSNGTVDVASYAIAEVNVPSSATGNKPITATTTLQTGIDVSGYATVSVAPTPTEEKSTSVNGEIVPSSGKFLSKVTVSVPTGTARTATDVTVSGATVSVPAGLYSSAVEKSVASGTAGTPTANKGTVTNNQVSITPSVTNVTGYITGSTKTGTAVTVSASELVSGNKPITATTNTQSEIDVTNYATVSVDPTPSETKTATENGTVTPSSGKLLSSVIVAVPDPSGNIELTKQTGTDVSSYATASVRSASVSLNTPTVNSSGLVTASASVATTGWVSSAPSNKTLQLTTQAAKTVTPSTSAQTAVASGVYTTGAITVAAIQTETKTATTNGDVTPSSGKYLTKVTVAIPIYDGTVI